MPQKIQHISPRNLPKLKAHESSMPPALGPASTVLPPPIWVYCVAVWVTLFPVPKKSPPVQRQPAAAAGLVQAALRRELGGRAFHAQADVETMRLAVVVWQKEAARVSGERVVGRVHGWILSTMMVGSRLDCHSDGLTA
ncbi:hypothetical protein K438DRAFT_1766408 [Mycena galopus ATCC 62051]|nr:hypothetical protein K438DRAFT_1766408 [Mycena galopus ATCC 62051]